MCPIGPHRVPLSFKAPFSLIFINLEGNRCGTRKGIVLDGEVNQKLGRGSRFYGDSVSPLQGFAIFSHVTKGKSEGRCHSPRFHSSVESLAAEPRSSLAPSPHCLWLINTCLEYAASQPSNMQLLFDPQTSFSDCDARLDLCTFPGHSPVH